MEEKRIPTKILEEPKVGEKILTDIGLLSRDEIAEILGMSSSSFYKRLVKRGWDSPKLFEAKRELPNRCTGREIGNDEYRALSDDEEPGEERLRLIEEREKGNREAEIMNRLRRFYNFPE